VYRSHLGWLQLKKQKLRLLVAVAGVCFAVTLILMWAGLHAALYESAARYHDELNYEVVLLNPETSFIGSTLPFTRRRLYQALGLGAVEAVSPVYLGNASWKNPFDFSARSIFVVGFDPADTVFRLRDIREGARTLQLPDVVFFDRASRPEFGPVAERYEQGELLAVEVNHRALRLAGLFELGTSFGIMGALVTSDTNFLRIFPDRQHGLIDLGLVHLHDGEDPVPVRDSLRAMLPQDVLVLTKVEFIQREKDYWAASTPIGYVMGFGAIMAFVVGSIIVYQILFADVSDHLAEYATLRAIGHSNAAVSSVVVEQALILAVLGFLPGWLLAVGLYQLTENATLLPLRMTIARMAGVLGLAIVMCCISGLMALRKVRTADPAEVF
jgi:putative ABC transport system permease protein